MTITKPSKSALKREYLALQALGEALLDLSEEQLAEIDTDELLIEQVLAAQKIRSHGALRRQKQLIGKIMRALDPAPIRAALEELSRADRSSKAIFRQSEQWRDRIAAEGKSALQALIAECDADDNTLADELANYENSQDDTQRRLIRRRMFKEIHNMLAAKMQNPGR